MNMMFSVIKSAADRGLSEQIVHKDDFYDDSGLLVCGKCKEHRQTIMDFPNPTAKDPNCKTSLKVVAECRCDREKAEYEKLAKDKEYVAKIKKNSYMDEKFYAATFSSFAIDKYNERNFRLCKRYATAFDEMLKKNQGLMFWGGVGTGKSYAAACIANHLLEQKIPVVMISTVRILENIEKGKVNKEELFERMYDATLLIVDDLGAERNSSFALEKIYNIIDTRCGSNMPMIVTTNMTLEEMQSEADIRLARVCDRLIEVCHPMQFTGPSRRKKAAWSNYNKMSKLFEDEF